MKLYYYTSQDYALQNIFNRSLKVSLLNSVNDPFENCFEIEPTVKRDHLLINSNYHNDRYTRGMICFSSNCNQVPMWGHYADNHRGICLGFEVKSKDDKLLQVKYKKYRPHFKNPALMSFKQRLQIKHKIWSYEKEYRLICNLKDCQQISHNMFFYNFGTSETLKLTDIVLGLRCNCDLDDIKYAIRDRENTTSLGSHILLHKTMKDNELYLIRRQRQHLELSTSNLASYY